MAPNGARRIFFLLIQTLPTFFGRTDFDFDIFSIFPAHAKNGPRWPQMGPGGFFPANPDLADILGRRNFDFGNLHVLMSEASQIRRFLDSLISKRC